jgi:eukaryotic-like serine/threonine-protein kinase
LSKEHNEHFLESRCPWYAKEIRRREEDGLSMGVCSQFVTLTKFLYIFSTSRMKSIRKIKLKDLRTPAIALVGFLIVFYMFNNIVMPQYVQQGKTTKVPNVVGKGVDEALRILSEAGLPGKKTATPSPSKQYPEGSVVVQNPPAGAEVKFGRGVYVTVSGGEPLVAVPSLRGQSLRDATFSLERVGLVMGSTTYQVSEEYPQGTIIDQDMLQSSKVSSGKVINVTVSQGKNADQVPVPDVMKKTFSEAERIVIQAGLRIGNITYQVNAELLPNTVIDQFPKSGQLAPAGQAIDLVVAQKGEKPNDLQN